MRKALHCDNTVVK